jgi:hypothetical protein
MSLASTPSFSLSSYSSRPTIPSNPVCFEPTKAFGTALMFPSQCIVIYVNILQCKESHVRIGDGIFAVCTADADQNRERRSLKCASVDEEECLHVELRQASSGQITANVGTCAIIPAAFSCLVWWVLSRLNCQCYKRKTTQKS